MGDALIAIVLLAALVAGTPAPAPTPPFAKMLPVIGRVRVTTPLCKTLLGDASRAVTVEADNDRRIGTAVTTLKGVDLDSSLVAKQHGVADLTRQFVALRAAAVSGNATMHHFREVAKGISSDDQRAKLISFADALDGALHRQKALADDIGRFIAYVDAHAPMTKDEHDQADFDAIANENDARLSARTPFDPRDFGPTAGVPEQLTTISKSAGAQVETRAAALASDEKDASEKIEPAFSAC